MKSINFIIFLNLFSFLGILPTNLEINSYCNGLKIQVVDAANCPQFVAIKKLKIVRSESSRIHFDEGSNSLIIKKLNENEPCNLLIEYDKCDSFILIRIEYKNEAFWFQLYENVYKIKLRWNESKSDLEMKQYVQGKKNADAKH